MLEEVRIRDLALLEQVEFRLSSGLNVLSGETGEGKSLLLQAVALLLGARARRGLVRADAGSASIEGRFRLRAGLAARLSSMCDLVPPDAEEIVLRRVVLQDGSSRASIEGGLVSVGVLGRIGAELVDVHGQGASFSALQEEERARLVDRFGGLEELETAHAAALLAWRDADTRARRRAEDSGARTARLELLRFQVSELDRIAPADGEESSLAAELRVLAKSADFAAALGEAESFLDASDDSVTARCARLQRAVRDGRDHPRLGEWLSRLERLADDAADLAREGVRIAESIPSDEEALRAREERLGTIRDAARKHRVPGDRLAGLHAGLRGELAALESEDASEDGLERRAKDAHAAAALARDRLLQARREAAARLEPEVKAGLSELRMERAGFRIEIGPEDRGPGSGPGIFVRFLVSPNPGEPEQPIERIASGGELARIVLAVKSALAGVRGTPLLVLDEIDAGIGGRVGLSFGRRIAAMADHHQVLVVTHLPQVAAFATCHLRVKKTVSGGRTRTVVQELSAEERVVEITEMLGFAGDDAGARRQAKSLIKEAQA